MNSQSRIYTIGYSGYGNDPELFISDLKKHNINVVIDVRSDPYSGRFDAFNRDVFKKTLSKNNIIYRNYSNEFGAKQLDRSYYSCFDGENSRIDYDIFTKTKQFLDGVGKLKAMMAAGHKPALMCSEKDPLKCHRAIMIANELFNKYGLEVIHIVSGEKDESQRELELRMMEMIKKELKNKKKMNILEQKMKQETDGSFFSDKKYADDVQNYYRIMNSRIGWKLNEVLGYK